MYVELVNATLISADPRVDETLRKQAVEYLESFLESADCFKVSAEIFSQGAKSEYSTVTRMFCLTAIEKILEKKYDSDVGRVNWDDFWEELWVWYERGVDEKGFIRNKLIKVFVLLFWKRYYDRVNEFFYKLASIHKENDCEAVVTGGWIPNADGKFSTRAEMFLKVCKVLNEELILAKVCNTEDDETYLERSNEIKDTMRQGLLISLIREWLEILRRSHDTNELVLMRLCLDTLSGYISWIPLDISSNNLLMETFVESLSKNDENVNISVIECLTQIFLKKVISPLDKLAVVEQFNMESILEKLIDLNNNGSFELCLKLACLLNAYGLCYCEGWKYEKSSDDQRHLCLKKLEKVQIYVRRVLLLDNGSDDGEVVSTLMPYITFYLRIISSFFKKFITASEMDSYVCKSIEMLRTIIMSMKYSEDFTFNELDSYDEDFPYSSKRAVLRKLFNTIGNIIPDLQVNFIFELAEDTFKPLKAAPSSLNISWNDLELVFFLISLVKDSIPSRVKNAVPEVIYDPNSDNFHGNVFKKIKTMIEYVLDFVKAYGTLKNETLMVSYLQALFKHYKFFEYNQDKLLGVLEYLLNNKDSNHLSHQTRTRNHFVLKTLIKTLNSDSSSYVKDLLEFFKNHLYHIINTLPSEFDKNELKENRRNHSPSNVNVFEVASILIIISDMSECKKMDSLKEIITIIVNKMGELITTSNVNSPDYFAYICKLNHTIIALGNLCKDFTIKDSNQVAVKHSKHASSSLVSNDPKNVQIFDTVIEAIVATLSMFMDEYYVRTAALYTFRRMVNSAGNSILKNTLTALKKGLLEKMFVSEVSDVIYLFTQIIAKMEVDGRIIVELLCIILNRLHTLSSHPENGTDYQNDLSALKRNYLNLVLTILSLKNSYDLILLLHNFNFFHAVMDSLIALCYGSDHYIQKLALMVISKFTSIYAKHVLRINRNAQHISSNTPPSYSPPNDLKLDFPVQNGNANPSPNDIYFNRIVDSTPFIDGTSKEYLFVFNKYLLEKVVPMLFDVLQPSNLTLSDAKSSSIIYEVTNVHFEIMELQGYNYPSYLGKVFFQSVNIPSPYANNLMTVLTSNDRKACINLLTNYVSHLPSHGASS